MQAVMETLFDTVYLISVITIGIVMIRRCKGERQFRLFGWMAVVLGAGDAFHLIPRAFALCTTGLENYTDESLYDADVNIRIGCWYLARLYGQFGSIPVALAAYNAGEGTVRRWLAEGTVSDGACTDIPYAETAAYVRRVKKFYKLYDFFYI